MIQSNEQFDGYQLGVMIVSAMLGVAILQLPAGIAQSVGSESWIVIILGGLLAIFSIFLICKAGSVYNGNGLVDASKSIFGKKLGTILVIPVMLCIFIATVEECRIFTSTVKIFLLEKTPSSAVLIPFLLSVMLLARGELKHILRFFQIVIPFIIVIIFVLNALTLPGADFTNLLPVFQRRPLDYLEGLEITIFSFLGGIILLVIYPYLKKRDFKNSFKASFIGALVVMVLYVTIVVLSLAKLGADEIKWIIYPTVNLIKSAYIPGSFVERLEGILMSIWVLLAYITTVISVYSVSVIIADIFKFKSTRPIVTILVPLVYMSSASVFTVLDILEIAKLNNAVFGLYSMFIFPGLLYLVYKIKSRKRGE